MHAIEIRRVERFPEPEFSRLQRRVFDDVQQYSGALASALAEEAGTGGGTVQQHAPMSRFGAYEGGELVGWSFGWMERSNVFYVSNSGVVASHRRRGIYTALLHAIRDHATTDGAWAIRSQHSVLNNPVIIAKLQAGFNISGLSQSAHMGTLVELTLHLSEKRLEMYRRRVVPYAAGDV